MQKKQIGNSGEQYCVDFLKQNGYEILEKNYHSPYGEIDIIAKQGKYLVFLEIKTRTKDSVDHAKWDISLSKQKKITKTAMCFLMNYNNLEIMEYRFDVIIVKNHEINHFIDAFQPPDVGDFFA